MATKPDRAASGMTAASSDYDEIEVEITDSDDDDEEGSEQELEELEYEEVEVEEDSGEEEEEEEDNDGSADGEAEEDTKTAAKEEVDEAARASAGAEMAPSPMEDGATAAPQQPTAAEEKTEQVDDEREESAAVMAAEESPMSPVASALPSSAAQAAPSQAELLGNSPAAAATCPGGSQPMESLKEVETKATEATAKAAADLSSSFMSMGSKLSSAFSSVSQTMSSADTAHTADKTLKDAQESVNKLVGGFSNWWSSIDANMGAQQGKEEDDTASKVTGASQASAELQKLFGLPDHENLVESFKCKLLQTYSCNHNAVTPAIQMAFQGTLYITDRHTCFTVEERGRKLPFKVLHTEIVTVQRQRPSRKGDLSDVLRIQLSKEDNWMAFKDFGNSGDLDSALALLEHLTE